jgi:hypothetical protein
MQQYNQYGQPVYTQYQNQHYQQAYQSVEPQMYEHQQYLQAQLQPQQAIDPSLEIMLSDAPAHGQESHFETAIGDMTTGDLGMLDYYDQQTSPDATLAPQWSPTDGLK